MQTEVRRLTLDDVERAEALWAKYQRSHDVSDRIGTAAGIDPETGRIWFGESALEIMDQLDAERINAPLYFVRVGSATYYRKGWRHWPTARSRRTVDRAGGVNRAAAYSGESHPESGEGLRTGVLSILYG